MIVVRGFIIIYIFFVVVIGFSSSGSLCAICSVIFFVCLAYTVCVEASVGG